MEARWVQRWHITLGSVSITVRSQNRARGLTKELGLAAIADTTVLGD